ncbi:tyrosine-type recombinase/integrase [Pseudoxanthomonas mexicana]
MDNVVVLHPAARADTLADFAETWFDQVSIGWRDTTQRRVDSILRCHVLPEFQRHDADGFDRAAMMAWRAKLVREGLCTPNRANAVMQVASQCLGERERQRGIVNPCRDLRRLSVRRPAIQPFSLPELRRLVDVAPPHLAEYVWIRGLTGLRSGEANGLRWDCVDLAAGTLDIRRARSDGRDRLPKNEFSERLIPLGTSVTQALQRQWQRTGSPDGYIFQTLRGAPLDIQNFARRDWRRMLAAADLTYRCPEQLRHTAATLMLAAGEAPTFVSHVLGHADCRMLLSAYARFMPGALGRIDGRALERAVAGIDMARFQ